MTTYLRIVHVIEVDDDDTGAIIDDLVDAMSDQVESIPSGIMRYAGFDEIPSDELRTPEFDAAHGEDDGAAHEREEGECATCGAEIVRFPDDPRWYHERIETFDHEVAPATKTDGLLIREDGTVERVTFDDTLSGVARVLSTTIERAEAMTGQNVRVYYDNEAGTDRLPLNLIGTLIASQLLGRELTSEDTLPMRGPLLIAGRPTLREDDVQIVAEIVPTFDVAGRW